MRTEARRAVWKASRASFYPPETLGPLRDPKAVPRAKLRDRVYRLNAEMARMVVAEGFA